MPSDVLVLDAHDVLGPPVSEELLLDEHYEPRQPRSGFFLLASARNGGLWVFVGLIFLALALTAVMQLPGKRDPLARSAAETAAIEATEPPKAFPITPPTQVTLEDAEERNDAIPIDRSALMASSPFRSELKGVDLTRARDCLAVAAWYEAGADRAGQKAVMQVVLNRVRHPSFPDTICGVVFQGAERRTGCQFTFTCDGSMLRRRPGSGALELARVRADSMLGGEVMRDVGTATHYHADYVQPVWALQLVKIAALDRHLFYRWPGRWGDRGVLTRIPLSTEPTVAALTWGNGGHQGTLAEVAGDEAPQIALLAPLDFGKSPTASAVAEKRVQVMALDTATPAGRFAIDALARCQGKSQCYIAGWQGRAGQGSVASADLAASPPDFLFVKRDNHRNSKAYWNCARFERSDPSQCLPNPADIAALLTGARG